MKIKKTGLTQQDISHIAGLANLKLSDAEISKFQNQLSEIVNFVAKIQEAPVENLPETREEPNLEKVTRDDQTTPSLSQEDALSNTKEIKYNFFKVEAIFDEM